VVAFGVKGERKRTSGWEILNRKNLKKFGVYDTYTIWIIREK
jgi:hypothetical protein